MKFPLFRRKTDQVALPKEVQNYYQAEKRERIGVASLLAIGTLIITVVLAFGIFFGGRWAWRHAFPGNTKKNNPATSTVKSNEEVSSSTSSTSSDATDTTATANSTTGTNSAASGAASSSPKTTPNPAPPTGNETANNQALPNTGPSNILPMIGVVIIISVALAEWYQRRATTDS
ncbi:MAG: hypothetical protein NVS1B7_1990 [Candidatus Saccharimonadales bacterium]